MKKLGDFLVEGEEITQKQLNDLEKFADRLLNKFDVDIEFTRHFADRLNDPRNKPAITVAELQRLFKKMAANKGKRIKKYGNEEAVLKDIQSDLNLPVVVNWKNGEFEVVNKTIMRKKGFKTSNPVIKYESKTKEDDIRDESDELDIDEKRMPHAARLKQRKYRRSAAGRRAARKHHRKSRRKGYRPNRRRARKHRIAARRSRRANRR